MAGLNKRFGWSPDVALWLQLAALAAAALGFIFTLWAMASNRFFSGVVRIQSDRGHTVATGGPYQFVRHPGYVGAGSGVPVGLVAVANDEEQATRNRSEPSRRTIDFSIVAFSLSLSAYRQRLLPIRG